MFRRYAPVFRLVAILVLVAGCGSSTTSTNTDTNGGNTNNGGNNGNSTTPASVEITPTGPVTMDVLQSTQAVTATVKNSSGATITASVTWTSDAPSVASIPATGGAVTALANGTAHITAKTDNGVTSSPLTIVVALKASVSPLVRIAGDGQQAVVNTSLVTPLTVQANDAAGKPLAGVSVSFNTTFGTLSATTVTTGLNGQATSVWNMPTVSGTGTAIASLTNTPTATVSFSAVALTGPAQFLVKVDGDAQRGTAAVVLPTPIIVKVTDQFNNGVSGIPVTLAVTSGGGTLSGGNLVTAANGQVSATWTLGSNESLAQSVVVSSAGLSGSPALFSATAIRATVGTLAPSPFNAGCHVSTTVTGIAIGDASHVAVAFDGVPASFTLTNPTSNSLTLTATAPSLTRASGTAAVVTIQIFSQTFTQNLTYNTSANCT